MTARVAFYAPLKSPHHPIPSGDREIARLMMRALEQAGYDVALVSETISYQKRPSKELFDKRRREVEAERTRLTELWKAEPAARPDLWFTYHPYCKSPDWLGPPLCTLSSIPYATAEACRTHQATDADWRAGRAAVQRAVRQADANFVLKETDWAYLTDVLGDMASAVRIPPFLDLAAQPPLPAPRPAGGAAPKPPVMFAAGMMRPGAKAESYRLLAEALRRLDGADWRLVVAGEGPQRPAVEAALAFLSPDRVDFLGSVPHEDIFALMDSSDLFVWPGVGEAIGLVYLEAQSRGLPVAAMRTAGVPLVVADGTGGLLTAFGDPSTYAAAIGRLLGEPALRQQLGAGGKAYVRQHHDVSAVAAILRQTLDRILAARPS